MIFELQYLVDAHHRYDGCVPIELGDGAGRVTMFAPPWETAQFNPDEVVDEIVRFQMQPFTGARVDADGNFYQFGTESRGTGKKTCSSPSSIYS